MPESANQVSQTTVSYKGRDYAVQTGLFINNRFVPSVSSKTFPTVNPVTEEIICHVHEGFKEDVDIAVEAAKQAFKVWSSVSPSERGRLLFKLADLLERDAQTLAELESLDNGKPVKDARTIDLNMAVATYRYYAGYADKIHGRVVDVEKSVHAYTKREPFGVVGQIIPWNFPILMQAWKLAPALACGNTVVLKSSEKTPLTALKVAELIIEAGFPPGVVNILSGHGHTAGDAIVRHPDVTKVAFTGSTTTGRKIMATAAKSNLKKVSLELGGKSPQIVFKDADLEKAVQAACQGIYFNMGQCCNAGSRVFVQEEIYDDFVNAFKAATKTVKVGDPFDESTINGPIVDSIQFNRVLSYIDSGKKDGAKVETGGNRLPSQPKGYFIEPTLFTNVRDDMKIAQEEIFGPVLVAMKFKTVDEVVERANKTTYGLAAAVHTRDIKTAVDVSGRLAAGTVWVNCFNVMLPQMPFGGYKQSGFGRELGKDALQEYTQIKSVMMSVA
ncbi:hypothetical protein HK102_010732 [Quaeritorhiza haematococci]|nr:hypothetical protein HK102_010732 [Quaeritorhiza haematococci]